MKKRWRCEENNNNIFLTTRTVFQINKYITYFILLTRLITILIYVLSPLDRMFKNPINFIQNKTLKVF